MNYGFTIISLLFFLSTFIYIFWGGYIMWIDSKSSTNKLFALLCISLSIWSFGLGMTHMAESLKSALFWHRFAALGWTSSYGFVLHFCLLMSGENKSRKRKNFYWLVHLPGILSMYIFSLSNKLAPLHYNLIKSEYGWINRLTNNKWDAYFNFYYITYMLIGILLVWNWQSKIKEKKIARQGQLIGASLLISFIIGSFTDRVASRFLGDGLPQIAPLLILLPTWAMYHSARYYGLMNKKNKTRDDVIVTAEDKRNISDQLTLSYLGIGLLVFLSEYVPHMKRENAIKLALAKSMIFVFVAILIRLIQWIKNPEIKEILTIITLASSVPIIILQQLKYGSITIWAFPMIVIIIATIFSRKTLLFVTTLVAILTQVFIWVLYPEVTVLINRCDYVLRIGLFIAAFSTGIFINKIYVDKIKEIEFQTRFQKLNTRISSDFININEKNIDEKFNKMLDDMGLFFNPDRISLFSLNDKTGQVNYSHEWCNEGIKSEIENFKNLSYQDFSWWDRELKKNKVVSIGDVRKISEDAINEKKQLEKLNIKSVVCVPVEGKKEMNGFLIISSINSYRKWPDEDIKLLNILANLISDALVKINSERELEYMAYYDKLTNLPNRILFKKNIEKAIEENGENDEIISVIYMDLNKFKSVNGILGYAGGDELLVKVAKRLREEIGEYGQVARFSADEFMIRVKNLKSKKDIFKVADKIIALFSEPFTVQGQELLISNSAGISIYPQDGRDADSLIENASLAMHYVKDKGESAYTLCTSKMKEDNSRDLSLLNDLYGALERDELLVYYQAQVNIETGKINGMEALVRWDHPERGMISPGLFIPLAEQNGLINDIGKWVLKTSCMENKKWQKDKKVYLPISVNLSAVQLIDANIVDYIKNVLKKSNLDPKYLELEITESVTIKDESRIEKVMNELKNMGIAISIDDFGTEYSSFSRLKALPIDRIKIDMQFIQGIEKNKTDRTITKIMIKLAKGLGVNVIAEGVETKEQLDFLKDNACDDVQGYYYHKPMAKKDFEKLLD